MPVADLRRARIEEPLSLFDGDSAVTLDPGEIYIEESQGQVGLHADASGSRRVARVELAEFNDWLARRQLVFLSWG